MHHAKLAFFPSNPVEQEDKHLLGAHPQNNSAVCGQEQDHEEDYQREKSVEPGEHSLPELHLLGEGWWGGLVAGSNSERVCSC